MKPFERRMEDTRRVAQRADLILAHRLKRQGRAAGDYTADEYVEALREAGEEIAALNTESGPDMEALRRSPGGLAATAERVEVVLAEEGLTLADIEGPDEYVRRFEIASRELYREMGW